MVGIFFETIRSGDAGRVKRTLAEILVETPDADAVAETEVELEEEISVSPPGSRCKIASTRCSSVLRSLAVRGSIITVRMEPIVSVGPLPAGGVVGVNVFVDEQPPTSSPSSLFPTPLL